MAGGSSYARGVRDAVAEYLIDSALMVGTREQARELAADIVQIVDVWRGRQPYRGEIPERYIQHAPRLAG